eukprot:1051952-Alexandrium_andersonii.AAC.1
MASETSTDTPATHSVVPEWDGDLLSKDAFLLKVQLYVKGTKKDEKGTCASRVMSRLKGNAWQWVLNYPHMDTIEKDTIPETSTMKLPQGMQELLDYLLEKAGAEPVADAGKFARAFLREIDRPPHVPMKEWITSFEKSELDLRKALKVLDRNLDLTKPIFPGPLQAWFLLECAGLTERERGQVMASTNNTYNYAKIAAALRTQFERRHLSEGGAGRGHHGHHRHE